MENVCGKYKIPVLLPTFTFTRNLLDLIFGYINSSSHKSANLPCFCYIGPNGNSLLRVSFINVEVLINLALWNKLWM